MAACEVIGIVNQKGGIGKTATSVHLGISLAQQGKKVLLVDADPQAHLTISLGWKNPEQELETTLANHLEGLIDFTPLPPSKGILQNPEGVDVMPANVDLAEIEAKMITAMERESLLKKWVNGVKHDYDFVIMDSLPSLGMLHINVLAASDKLIVPVQTHYLASRGMVKLLNSVQRIKSSINPSLKVDGLLLTMADRRTNHTQSVELSIRNQFGKNIKVYQSVIPFAVATADASKEGKSLFSYDRMSKAAIAYQDFSREVMSNGEKERGRVRAGSVR